ncbi:MAG: hypothetical protein ACREP4_13735 [Stenotrophomonas sp.]|uniref:hypothetical protein n=1 Tax=Stenotrophomonas sp. TaxID=69392 RepID=UPI003D6D392D
MLNLKNSSAAIFLLSIAMASAAQNGKTPMWGSFKLVSETTSSDVSLARTSATLLRTYQLENGDYVELIHAVRPDGMLELDASRQPESTLTKLDKYCSKFGGEVVRTGIATLTKDAQALLACGGSSLSEGAKSRRNEAVSPAASAARAFCGATMSIVMDGPGSVYRGDPGGFAVHADAEWEEGGAIVSWRANFLPGCTVGESSHRQRWLWASRAVVCGTGLLSLGMHEGIASIEACNSRDYGFITTEIWK